MPHLSPMQWMTMMLSSWMTLSLIFTNSYYSNITPNTYNLTKSTLKTTSLDKNTNWKW